VVGDRIADPGNAGTMLRSAEAAGAGAVVFTSGSVDVFNPKTVRASAGALFTVPTVVVDVDLADALAACPGRTWGASSHVGIPYLSADFVAPTVLVVGNEAHGLEPDAPVDGWVTIPHAGRAESLNVAMAATLLVFEVARQRSAR
jgi:TrmH family RNA methyltransferase